MEICARPDDLSIWLTGAPPATAGCPIHRSEPCTRRWPRDQRRLAPELAGSVILTVLAAVLALVPLTVSGFWGSPAHTRIGDIIGGAVLTLVFLPAL